MLKAYKAYWNGGGGVVVMCSTNIIKELKIDANECLNLWLEKTTPEMKFNENVENSIPFHIFHKFSVSVDSFAVEGSGSSRGKRPNDTPEMKFISVPFKVRSCSSGRIINSRVILWHIQGPIKFVGNWMAFVLAL